MYPGCKHGSCNGSAWKCVCDTNWGGILCDQGEYTVVYTHTNAPFDLCCMCLPLRCKLPRLAAKLVAEINASNWQVCNAFSCLKIHLNCNSVAQQSLRHRMQQQQLILIAKGGHGSEWSNSKLWQITRFSRGTCCMCYIC